MSETHKDIPQPNHAALMAELRALRSITEARFDGLEKKVDAHNGVNTKRLDDHSGRLRQVEKDNAVHKWGLRATGAAVVALLGHVGANLTGFKF